MVVDWGLDTEGTDVEVLLCPSGEVDTHSSSLLFVLPVCMMSSGFLSLCLVGDSLLRLLLDSFGSATCVFFHRLASFVKVVKIVTVVLTAV